MLVKMVLAMVMVMMTAMVNTGDAGNNNPVYSPCSDSRVKRGDGFTFGLAFSDRRSFFLNDNSSSQLSPCDRRLPLSSSGNARLALFRPKVDEISLLTVNTSGSFSPENYGGNMVAFAGRKYAARSIPTFVANTSYIITSHTLVLEFKKGRLENLYWKRDGCASCSGKSSFVCLNQQDCAIRMSSCKGHQNSQGTAGTVDCSLGIQVAFSGTDKHEVVLNSWYEVSNLRQYSLYVLYSNLRDSLTSEYSKFF